MSLRDRFSHSTKEKCLILRYTQRGIMARGLQGHGKSHTLAMMIRTGSLLSDTHQHSHSPDTHSHHHTYNSQCVDRKWTFVPLSEQGLHQRIAVVNRPGRHCYSLHTVQETRSGNVLFSQMSPMTFIQSFTFVGRPVPVLTHQSEIDLAANLATLDTNVQVLQRSCGCGYR